MLTRPCDTFVHAIGNVLVANAIPRNESTRNRKVDSQVLNAVTISIALRPNDAVLPKIFVDLLLHIVWYMERPASRKGPSSILVMSNVDPDSPVQPQDSISCHGKKPI